MSNTTTPDNSTVPTAPISCNTQPADYCFLLTGQPKNRCAQSLIYENVWECTCGGRYYGANCNYDWVINEGIFTGVTFLGLLYCIYVWTSRGIRSQPFNTKKLLFLIILIFWVSAFGWKMLQVWVHLVYDYKTLAIITRICGAAVATTSAISCMALIIFFWAEVLSTKSQAQIKTNLNKFRNIFIVIVSISFVLAIIDAWGSTTGYNQYTWAIANIYFLIACFVLSIGFRIYGFNLLNRLQFNSPRSGKGILKMAERMKKFVYGCLTFTVTYFLIAIALVASAMTGEYLTFYIISFFQEAVLYTAIIFVLWSYSRKDLTRSDSSSRGDSSRAPSSSSRGISQRAYVNHTATKSDDISAEAGPTSSNEDLHSNGVDNGASNSNSNDKDENSSDNDVDDDDDDDGSEDGSEEESSGNV